MPDFQWIVCNDGVVCDPEARRAIRIQAMATVLAQRKMSRTRGKQNKLEESAPEFTVIPNKPQPKVPSRSLRARNLWSTKKKEPQGRGLNSNTSGSEFWGGHGSGGIAGLGHWPGRLARPMPLDGFELLNADTGLNVLVLDEFTSVTAGPRAAELLCADPKKLKKLVLRRRDSYLSHIPSRYNSSACVQDALRCLAIKAKRSLCSETKATTTADELRLYGKALRSLQAAVNESGSSTDVDVLCAIEILSLCEVRFYPTHPVAQKHICPRLPASYRASQ
jgi:hypothetical protein